MSLITPSILNIFKGSRASHTPTRQDLWFLPLGGTGEIGMNLNLYGHQGQWLMVDCGIGFNETGLQRYLPDTRFLDNKLEQLQAIVITHGHQDHIGAIAHLWPLIKAPVYATPFAAKLLQRTLSRRVEFSDDPDAVQLEVPIHIIEFHREYNFGHFKVTWLPVPHSIPEASALLIETSAGKILHSGDWKLEAMPVIDSGFAAADFKALHKLGIDAMIADSTNALKTEKSVSEGQLYQPLLKVIKEQPGRVIVSCFSTNISRLITLARIAKKLNKHFTVLGRSMEDMLNIAKVLDYWPADLPTVNPRHIGYLPANEVMVVATGSQAEPNATLQKLLGNRHPWLYLETGDTVLYSSIRIPVNEARILQQMQGFRDKGINVIHADDEKQQGVCLHASGHPTQLDLKAMYAWVKPKMLIPTHGEIEHLNANAEVAKQADIDKVVCGADGDLFKLKPFAKKVENFIELSPVLLEE